MKQFEAHDVKIGEYEFHIFPFGAFRAANLSAELTSTFAPILPVIGTFISSIRNGGSILDANADTLIKAFQSVSGDKLEKFMKELLVNGKNITVETENGVVQVTEGRLDELFTGEVENLYRLAVEVIKLNYMGFFESIATLFGSAK